MLILSSNKSGRPFSEIWKTDIKRGESKGNGHYSGTCQYCSTHWKRAKSVSLKIHLTKCNLAPNEVRDIHSILGGHLLLVLLFIKFS
ncbi:hypothetical protein RhiirA4_484502 [Rhizophagus irregularis]|uniref:BED-type domain-containing protein n=1 Tax=Rhizophagus irregularis TaxID=588596 RepID=A0A2I1HNZ2_9GLOM|nr:hypothetical protein RhiirA4_484502 [Rhizophagus irregularis]